MLNIILIVIVAILIGGLVVYWRRGDRQNKLESNTKYKKSSDVSRPPEESLRDPITQLYNRTHLLRRLNESMARCDRGQEKMILILWDIDGFVEFNNQYGQKEGDHFLKRVGDIVRNSLRIYDEAFRSGADEFCAILLPGDEKIAEEVRDRVKEAVSKSLFEGTAEYAHQQFSISSGLVSYPSDQKIPEALLYAAGEALYANRSHHKRSSV